MPNTLYLDPTAWDLALSASGDIAMASEPYALAQDAASAIRTFIGECWYDTTIGIPYWSQILGQQPPIELVKQWLIAAALTVPDVVAAQVFLTSINRVISGQVQVTNAAGVVTTNEVAPATSKVTKERTFLPDNYALFMESDLYGGEFSFATASSPYPNVKVGINHTAMRWIPTSTNELHAPRLASTGNVNNKAVPFWMLINGSFQSGDLYLNQGTDTNGDPSITITAIRPGTPTNQVPYTAVPSK